MQIQINGRAQAIDSQDSQPLLWLLREQLGLSGTKFGCGIGVCGACTVQIDGQPQRSCTLPARDLAGRQVRTIEALDQHPRGRALQQAWLDLQVPQCGYCQSGMLMAADALLASTPNPSEAQIAAAMTNLCRCGTYPRVKAAIQAAVRTLAQGVMA
jgi:isoquinoline 1-oxidoreductase alpha subunit